MQVSSGPNGWVEVCHGCRLRYTRRGTFERPEGSAGTSKYAKLVPEWHRKREQGTGLTLLAREYGVPRASIQYALNHAP